jgi:hypothetical protein
MIPAHFGVGIGNAALVGHGVGHTRKSGCIQARGFVPMAPSKSETTTWAARSWMQAGWSGLADRLSVLGGRLAIDSPRGGPRVIAADIPLAGP